MSSESSACSNTINNLKYKHKDLSRVVACNRKKIGTLCDFVEECCDNAYWLLETGTGPTGQPTSGPFQVFHQDTVRLHSSSINITAQTGSVLVNF